MPPNSQDKNLNNNHGSAKTQVVIVGAGASGLQCASILKRNGFDCVIIEARDRIGGRIHSQVLERTTTDGTNVEFTMDYGAAWVHGLGYEWPTGARIRVPKVQPNPMMELLIQNVGKQAAFEEHLQPVFPGNPWTRPKFALFDTNQIIFYQGGKQIETDNPIIRRALKRNNAILDRVEAIGFERENQDKENFSTSVQEIIDKVKTERDFVTNDKDLELVTGFYQLLYECWSASRAGDLQLSEFMGDEEPSSDEEEDDDEDFIWDGYEQNGDYSGPHCTVVSGMKTLLDPLLTNGVKECILLGQEVISIGQRDGRIVVVTGTGLTIEAEGCVVTIPLACLKKAISPENIRPLFQNPLSKEKLKAIQTLRVGPYKKVFLTFSKIFWSQTTGFLGLLNESGSGPLGKYILVDNLWANRGIPCLEVILLNEQANWATHKSTEAILQELLTIMESVMGVQNLNELLIDSHVTRWEEDPFSLGAYSSHTLGATEDTTDALREPEWDGKLIFCGEATNSEHEGSVHSALMSGRRAAKEISDLLDQWAA